MRVEPRTSINFQSLYTITLNKSIHVYSDLTDHYGLKGVAVLRLPALLSVNHGLDRVPIGLNPLLHPMVLMGRPSEVVVTVSCHCTPTF